MLGTLRWIVNLVHFIMIGVNGIYGNTLREEVDTKSSRYYSWVSHTCETYYQRQQRIGEKNGRCHFWTVKHCFRMRSWHSLPRSRPILYKSLCGEGKRDISPMHHMISKNFGGAERERPSPKAMTSIHINIFKSRQFPYDRHAIGGNRATAYPFALVFAVFPAR